VDTTRGLPGEPGRGVRVPCHRPISSSLVRRVCSPEINQHYQSLMERSAIKEGLTRRRWPPSQLVLLIRRRRLLGGAQRKHPERREPFCPGPAPKAQSGARRCVVWQEFRCDRGSLCGPTTGVRRESTGVRPPCAAPDPRSPANAFSRPPSLSLRRSRAVSSSGKRPTRCRMPPATRKA
jgi:hypothetical protein